MTLHNPTTAGGKTEAKCTGHKSLIGVESLCPSMNVSWNVSCQIECVSSDSDTEGHAANLPWPSTAPEAATGAGGQATIPAPRASER